MGATINSHAFGPSVSVAGPGAPSNLQNMTAIPSDSCYSGGCPIGATTVPLVDVAQIGDGYACSAFPAGSLNGSFALIQRSLHGATACTFADKAANAQNAGAIGVILYLAPDRTSFPNPFVETVEDFYGPLVGMSNADGTTLKNYVDAHPGTMVTIDPAGAVRAPDAAANLLASYSSLGPSIGAFPPCSGCAPLLIKPDLVATGGGDSDLYPDPNDDYLYGFSGMYLAAENYDPLGELYSVNRYAAADGTSFAAPLTAGAAALVKQAHPGYTAAQIKSALVNWSNSSAVTASDCDLSVAPPCTPTGPLDTRWMGGGLLDAAAAAQATVVASPPTVSFGAIMTGASLPAAQTVTITNLGPSAIPSLAVAVAPQTAGAAITVDTPSLSLGAAGSSTASATFHVSVTGSTPAAGAYAGQINLTAADVAMHIPYLFLVGSNTLTTTGNLIPEYPAQFDWFAGQDAGGIFVQLVDANGVPVSNSPVTFSVSNNALTMQSYGNGEPPCSPASSTAQVICNTDSYGFAWLDVVLGSTTGSPDVIISASNALSNYVTFDIRKPPTIGAGGVVMNGSYTSPVAPGSYVSIFGTSLDRLYGFGDHRDASAHPGQCDRERGCSLGQPQRTGAPRARDPVKRLRPDRYSDALGTPEPELGADESDDQRVRARQRGDGSRGELRAGLFPRDGGCPGLPGQQRHQFLQRGSAGKLRTTVRARPGPGEQPAGLGELCDRRLGHHHRLGDG